MKILLVQTGFLGDLVLSTPVIAGIRKLYPEAEIYVLSTPLAADLVRHHKDVSAVLTFDKRKSQKGWRGFFSMLGQIRAERFDVVFSLHKSYRTTLLLFLSAIKKRYGFKEAAASFLYSKTANRKDLSHEVLRNLAIFRCLNKEPGEFEQGMQIAFPSGMRERMLELLPRSPGAKLIGIAPGSVWATKRWTKEGFVEVAKRLADLSHVLVLLGGPEDRAVAEEIASGLATSFVCNLVGKTSLIESAAVVSCLDLLLCNDSAPLHLASAAKTPVVALFCATVPEFGFGPWQTEAEVLGVSGLACRPCGRHGGNVCPTGTNDCQRKLSTELVLAAIKRLLAK